MVPRSSPPPPPAHAAPPPHSHRPTTAPARREMVQDLVDELILCGVCGLILCLPFTATKRISAADCRSFDEFYPRMQRIVLVNGDQLRILLHSFRIRAIF